MKLSHRSLLLLIGLLLAGCTSQKPAVQDTYNNNFAPKARVTTTGGNTRVAATEPAKPQPRVHEMKDWHRMDLLSFFNDAQKLQLSAARTNGIEPMNDNSNILPLVLSGKVVKITSCDEYVLATLSHSYPYLVPLAAQTLKDIGARVQEITHTKSRILVTSCLRTVEKQMDLSETNQNAASYSCHYYGTTFDLAYNAAGELKGGLSYEAFFGALCQAVHELREEGRLYIKYETGQHCLHMTVRK